MKSINMRLVNFGIGAIFFVIAIMTYLGTRGLPGHSGMFPRAIAVILLVLSVGIIVQFLRSKAPETSVKFSWREGTNFLVLLVAYALIPILGFYSSTVFMVWLIYLVGVGSFRVSHIIRGGAASIIVGTILYLLFHSLMQVQTPTGFLI